MARKGASAPAAGPRLRVVIEPDVAIITLVAPAHLEKLGSLDGVEWGVLFAATTVQLLPVLIFVVLYQRHLIEGLTAGATKG